MNQYEIKNISARTTPENEVIAVTFVMFATDPDTGEVADAGRHIAMPEPFEPAESYSEADLLALCEAEAEDKGVKALLDDILVKRANPAPVEAPPAVPIGSAVQVLTESEQRTAWFNDLDDKIFGMQFKFTRFQMGYSKRLAAAITFRDAGFVGDPTRWISSFAEATGISNQASAESVLAKAAEYDVGLEELEDLRMQKYLVLRADTLDAASAVYLDIIARATVVENGLS